MTALTGYIQGLGGGEKRTVEKQGKVVKLSVFENIDDVIVFNQAGETTQKTLTGKNKTYFYFNGFVDGVRSVRGITFTAIDKNTVKVEGTSTGNDWMNPNYTSSEQTSPILPAGTYTLSADIPAINGFQIYITCRKITDGTTAIGSYYIRGQNQERSITFTVNENFYSYIQIAFPSNATIDYEVTFQLETGSTATDYEPYCGGVPSPNPDYPQDIKGIGTKRQDGTYRVDIDYYDEREERDGRITASGLAYPLYEGDVLDFVNSKVIRANGYKEFTGSETWVSISTGYAIQITDMSLGSYQEGFSNRFIRNTSLNDSLPNIVRFGSGGNNYVSFWNVDISGVSNVTTWKTWLSNNPTYIVYPLASPVEEYITITGGDIADIGTAVVEADGTLTVKYDKVEMAIRKYSAKPDWQKIGYTDTPQIILDAFDYSKRIYDTWTPSASYAYAYRGDKEMKFFPDVDLTGATNYSAMFQESGIQFTEPLTIGDGSSTVINSQWMFQSSPIEAIELTTSDSAQKVQITNIFNGCSNLKNAKLTLSASGSMQNAFADCKSLKRIEDGLDTSAVTAINEAFRACSSLEYIRELDLSACTTCYRAFQNCTSLESAPYLNNILQNVNFAQMFWNCNSLKNLPFIRLSSASNLTNMFQGTGSNLDENSRKNLLWMLTGCTYSGTKTLAHLGFTSSMYTAASWEALSNYNEFVSEGWSIGYT